MTFNIENNTYILLYGIKIYKWKKCESSSVIKIFTKHLSRKRCKIILYNLSRCWFKLKFKLYLNYDSFDPPPQQSIVTTEVYTETL